MQLRLIIKRAFLKKRSFPSGRKRKEGREAMKKRMLLLFAFLLICIPGPATLAEGFVVSGIQSPEGRQEIFCSIAADDAAYLLSSAKSLYELDLENRQATPLPLCNASPEYESIPAQALRFHGIGKDEPVPDWLQKDASLISLLFSDGEALYGLNELNGSLYRVDIAQDGAALHGLSRLDFFSAEEQAGLPFVRSGAVCGESLYLLMGLTDGGVQASLFRFDMATGARSPVDPQSDVTEIARYRDGHLLLLEALPNEQWRITDYDPAAETFVPLYDSEGLNGAPVHGLVYDPWRDRVLVESGEEVLALSAGNACEVVTYLPLLSFGGRALAQDGRLLLLQDQAVYALSTLPQAQVRPLMISCDYPESWIEREFAQAHPQIAVKYRQTSSYDALALFAQHMTLRSDEIDIFELPAGDDTRRALEKGYYTPLNGSPLLRERAEACRPFFRETVMHGDEIAAVMRNVSQFTLGYSQYALIQLGLTPEDMPSTYMELLDFLIEWDERVGEAALRAGITPFGDGLGIDSFKATLFSRLREQYYTLMAQDASAIPRYEADLAQLLDKLTLACASIPESSPQVPYGDMNERFATTRLNSEPSYLFSIHASFHPGRRLYSNGEPVSDFVPMALTLPSQDRPLLLCDGTLFVVNPYSTQKELAIEWLAFYASHQPERDGAMFYGDVSPAEYSTYLLMKEHYAAEIERLKPRIEAAEGAEKRELEEQERLKQEKLRQIESIRWDVSEQSLADYERSLEQCTFLWNDAVFSDAFSPTWQAYMYEGKPGDEVAHDFFATHRMTLLEAE